MKRFIAICLSIVMLILPGVPVMAADSAQANILRLEGTEGTVSLANQTGKELTHKEGMKLQNGHTLKTAASSYAYVSLDADKAVKLDALSLAGINKNGKRLELLVSAGKLFFNVKTPLKEDETLDVRTSSMVTGIHGTAGYVVALDETHSSLTLLNGQASAASYNPQTGKIEVVEIKAGDTATFTTKQEHDVPEVSINKLKEEEVPGFVAQELKKDPALQEKITEETDLDVPKIVGDADETLKNEQAAQEEAQKEADKAKDAEEEEIKTPLFPDEVVGGGGSGGGGGGGGDSLSLTNPSSADIGTAFASASTVQISGAVAPGSMSVPAGKTLQLLSGASMTTSDTNSLNVNGTLRVDSGATLTNSGGGGAGIKVLSSNSMYIAGTLTNNGRINVGDGVSGNSGKLVIEATGKLDNTGNLFVNLGSLENNGTISSSGGNINNLALFVNNNTLTLTGGNLTNLPGDYSSPYMHNTGTISIGAGAAFDTGVAFVSSGTLTNNGTIAYSGDLFMAKEATLSGTDLNTKMKCDDSYIYANTAEEIFRYAPNNSTLTLDQPLTVTGMTLDGDKTLTWDLGDNTVTINNGNSIINTISALTITNGDISGSNVNDIFSNTDGKSVTFNNVNVANSGGGGCIQNQKNSTLVLSGTSQITAQTDTNAYTVSNYGGTLTIQDTATVISTGDGGALSCDSDATTVSVGNLIMTGGTISALKGIAVAVGNGSSFTMKGGSVKTEGTDQYAVKNPFGTSFSYSGGTVRAKGANYLCENIPAGYMANDTPDAEGWFTLVSSPGIQR